MKPNPVRDLNWTKTDNSSVVILHWKFPAQLGPAYISLSYRVNVRAEKGWDDRTLVRYYTGPKADQPGLGRFSRKHKIVKNLNTVTIKQVIIHLPKLLKFIFRKSHCVTFLVKKWKVPYQNTRLQFEHYPLYWTKSHFLPLVLNGKKKEVLIC